MLGLRLRLKTQNSSPPRNHELLANCPALQLFVLGSELEQTFATINAHDAA